MTVARDPKWGYHVNRPIQQRKPGSGSWVRINCVWCDRLGCPRVSPAGRWHAKADLTFLIKLFLNTPHVGEERSRAAASIQMSEQHPKSVAVHGYIPIAFLEEMPLLLGSPTGTEISHRHNRIMKLVVEWGVDAVIYEPTVGRMMGPRSVLFGFQLSQALPQFVATVWGHPEGRPRWISSYKSIPKIIDKSYTQYPNQLQISDDANNNGCGWRLMKIPDNRKT